MKSAKIHSSTWRRLTEAALAYSEADSEDDAEFMRARDRLRKAATAYQAELEPRDMLPANQVRAWLAALTR